MESKTKPSHQVFISYSTKDQEIAEQVRAALEERSILCWIASRDLEGGTLWGEAIVLALKASKALVLIFSQHAVDSPWVSREVTVAVSERLVIVTFRTDNALPSDELKLQLVNVHWLTALPPPLAPHIADLVRAVSVRLQAPVAPPRPPGAFRPGDLPAYTNAEVPFVGREAEAGLLRAAWQRCKEGVLQAVLITGEAGAGKTRLAYDFLAEQDRLGAHWVAAHSQASDDDPYVTLIEALRPIVANGVIPEIESQALAEVGRFLPDIARYRPAVAIAPIIASQQARNYTRWAWATFLAGLTRDAPLVLWLDDLQWADAATLDCLQYLVAQFPKARLMLLGTVRTEDAECRREYAALRERLGRGPCLTQIALDPLDEAQTRQLVQTLLHVEHAPFLGPRVHRYAGGNPLFVQETLRLLVEKGFLPPGWLDDPSIAVADLPVPAAAGDVLQARLGALSKKASVQRLLEAAAVIGRPFDAELAQAVSGLNTSAAFKAVDELVARRILRREDWQFGFTQELLRSAAYEALSKKNPLQCMLLHRAVVAQLEAKAGAAPAGLMLQELARHSYSGGLWPKAFAYQLKAGQAALALYELGIARKHLQVAEEVATKHLPVVSIADRLAYLVGLGDACGELGEPDCALTYYGQAFDLAQAVATDARPPEAGFSVQDARRQAADIARRTGRRHGWMGQLEEAHRWMTTGRSLIEPPQDASERDICALIDANSASLYYQEGDLARTETLARQAIECAGEAGAPAALGEAYMMLGVAQDTEGRPRDALTAYARGREIWTRVPDPFQVARIDVNMAIAYAILGDLPKAKRICGDALVYFDERVGDHSRAATALTNLGYVNYLEGDYGIAAGRHQRAIAYAQELEIPWLEAIARRNLAWIHVVRGELDAAESEAQRCQALEAELGMTDASSETCRILAHVAIGRADELTAASEPSSAAAQFVQAQAWAEKALHPALAQANRSEEGAAERLLGQVARRRGDLAAAETHLVQSLKTLTEIGDRLEAARTCRQLVWLYETTGASANALASAIRALAAFITMHARGEVELMEQGDRLRFPLPMSLSQAAELCRSEMQNAGWAEAASTSPTNDVLAVQFRCEDHRLAIRLTAGETLTVAALSTD